MDKVVLARSIRTQFKDPVTATYILEQLVETDHDGRGFLAALSSAGSSYLGTYVVGSSPEILIKRRGTQVFTHPLAGTAQRHPQNPDADQQAAITLKNSTKDLEEHRYVVEAIAQTLRPWCRELHVPDLPTLTRTDHLWHLGTPIHGTLTSHKTTALDLAVMLHPTPAVAGTPRSQAMRYIRNTEEERGFYAGTVGWVNASGDGHWRVLLRAGHLSNNGHTLTVHAGGGIVAQSVPEHELTETYIKFSTMLSALGAQQWIHKRITSPTHWGG